MATSEPEPLSVSYRLDQSDFVAWHQFFQRRHYGNFGKGFFAKAAALAMFLFFGGFALIFWLYRPSQMDNKASLVFVAVALFVLLLIAAMVLFFQWLRDGFAYVTAWWQFRKLERLPEEKRTVKMVLRDEGIYVEYPDGNWLLKWHAVESVEDEEKHLFFGINPRQAYIVPKRVLNAEQLSGFGEFARSRWEELHKSGVA